MDLHRCFTLLQISHSCKDVRRPHPDISPPVRTTRRPRQILSKPKHQQSLIHHARLQDVAAPADLQTSKAYCMFEFHTGPVMPCIWHKKHQSYWMACTYSSLSMLRIWAGQHTLPDLVHEELHHMQHSHKCLPRYWPITATKLLLNGGSVAEWDKHDCKQQHARTKISKLGAYPTNTCCRAGQNCVTNLVQVKSMLIKHMVKNPSVPLVGTIVHLYNQTALQSHCRLSQNHSAFLCPCPQEST